MSLSDVEGSMAQLSLNSNGETEDWDRSMTSDPRYVPFPAQAGANGTESTPGRRESLGRGGGKRTLSELLKLHGEKGTDVNFSPEEASRIAEVLGQWVRLPFTPQLLTPSCDVQAWRIGRS